MIKGRVIFICSILLVFLWNVFPQESSGTSASQDSSKDERLKLLLAGYLENDLQLKKYTLTARLKSLDLQSAEIDNGISVSLSTGEMKIQTSADRTKITVTPQASVGIPYANDASVDLSLPFESQDGEKTVSNGSLSISAGIITGGVKSRTVELMKAERDLLEAERNVRNGALTAEKEFYQSLKDLYNDAIDVLSAKSDLYEDSSDLRLLAVQGYSKSSATYRQADLKVQGDKRTVLEKQRIFQRETMVFARKCGIEYVRGKDESGDSEKSGQIAYESCLAYLPDWIPQVDGLDISAFDINQYASLESAVWDQKINELEREADYEMTLYATGQYKFNDSFTNCDSAGGKLTWDWNGLSASAGVYVPTGSSIFAGDSSLEKSTSPYFAFSLGLDLSSWRLAKIQRQQNKLNLELDQLEIESAREDYETDILDMTSSYNDIQWSQREYSQEYDMYRDLEADMSKWLKRGIVTESDYIDAKNNMEISRINVLINAVDLIIYNNESKLLFVDDE